MKSLAFIISILFTLTNSPNLDDKKVVIDILAGEHWWSGLSAIGNKTPYDECSVVDIDTWGNNFGNQALAFHSEGLCWF